MSTVPLSETQLRAQVASVLDKVPEARAIGIRVGGPWAGPGRLRIREEEVEVAFCSSALALRERLAALGPGRPRLVLLTGRSDADLGADVLARLAKRRLLTVEPWRVVMDLFRAREIDPAITRAPWLAEALLDSAPAGGYPPAASGVLDLDTVWQVVLRERLGFPTAMPDIRDLLRWTLDAGGLARFAAAPAELRRGVGDRLAEAAGPAGEAILACVLAGRGQDALPIGLACRVLFAKGSEAEPALREAAVRLEPATGGRPLARAAGLAWAEAAEAVLGERAAAEGSWGTPPWLARADAVLRELRAEAFAHRSPVLLSGFEQRLARHAEALRDFLSKPGGEAAALATAASMALDHHQARERPERAERIRMSWRLARWLRQDAGEAPSFGHAALTYAQDASFADRARARLRDGDPLPALAEAYRALGTRLVEARERQNQRFGTLLAGWLAAGAASDAAIPIEDVLSRVVARLGEHAPVLLLVIDGMSLAVFHELMEDLQRRGWLELGEGEPPGGRVAIAALPTITEVSRASLLCGTLRRGASQVEREGFASHPGLLAISRSAYPPALFHKGDLVEAGGGLATAVRREIDRPARQVVAVVVNAVDDLLARGDQIGLPWTVSALRPLPELLDAARDAGRAVVLTSDHGHVLEHDLALRPHDTGGPRYRSADRPPEPDELLLHGPRVLAPPGNAVIAPWSERVRYGPKQAGYHGGASPQEVVVPLAVLTASDRLPPGWSDELPAATPSWWELEPAPGVEAQQVEPVPRRPARQMPLIPVPAARTDRAVVPEPTPAPAWTDRLLASATYRSQRQLAGRVAPGDDRVRQCLLALDARGGKMTRVALARALDVPPLRLGGTLTALRRLLNVDGYPVLSVDEGSDTVELNRELLRVQFELEA